MGGTRLPDLGTRTRSLHSHLQASLSLPLFPALSLSPWRRFLSLSLSSLSLSLSLSRLSLPPPPSAGGASWTQSDSGVPLP